MAKILTVDDSRTIRDMVRFTVSNAGYDVAEAENGKHGLEVLKGLTTVNLIITDINMPEMDGLTFIREVRKNIAWQRIPILVLTTEGDDQRKSEGRAAGATGWIVKPFNPEKLIEVIRKVCP